MVPRRWAVRTGLLALATATTLSPPALATAASPAPPLFIVDDVAHGSTGAGAFLRIVDVSDPTSPGVSASVPIPVNGAQGDCVSSPDGTTVYVTDGARTIHVVDVASATVTATVPIANSGNDLSLAPDGSHLVATNGLLTAAVSLVATAAPAAQVGTATPGAQHTSNETLADGTVLVTTPSTGQVHELVVDAGAGTLTPTGRSVVVGPANLFSGPSNLAPALGAVAAINRNGSVSLFDPATMTASPLSVTFAGETGLSGVGDADTLYVRTGGAVRAIVRGDGGLEVAWTGSWPGTSSLFGTDQLALHAGYLWVSTANNVRILDPATGTAVGFVGGLSAPTGICAAPVSTVPDNIPPTADAGGPYATDEGSGVLLAGASASDDDGDALTYAWTVDTTGCGLDDATALQPTVTCDDDATVQATLTVSDGTASTSDTAVITVGNVAPTATLAVAPQPGWVGEAITATVTVADAGADEHTVAFDWGAGGTTSIAAVTDGQASASTSALGAGVYELTATVSDDDGGTVVLATEVVVVDPGAGFVTGRASLGRGADRLDLGVWLRYEPGAATPSGSVDLTGRGLDLHVPGADWLVIDEDGASARFVATGTLADGTPVTVDVTVVEGKPDVLSVLLTGPDGVLIDEGPATATTGNITVHAGHQPGGGGRGAG